MRLLALFVCLLLSAQLTAETHGIDVVSYRARLTIEPSARYLAGVATVTFRNVMRSDIQQFELDLRNLMTDRVEQEGVPLTFGVSDSTIIIHFDTPLRSLDTAVVTVWYHGNPTHDRTGYSGVGFGPRSVWAHPQSHIERYVAMLPHWLPCNNLFSDKATYDLTFDTPKGWRAASMGTLEDEQEVNDRNLAHWVLHEPLHPAGAGWAVGDYAVYRDTLQGIPFCAYVWPEGLSSAKMYFKAIDSMLTVFTTHYGPYPGEKIGFVATDSATCEVHTMTLLELKNLYGAAYETAGHELAHHWWGNCVTPMDVRENWLSEGFAMYGEWLITAALSRRRTFDGILKEFTQFYRVTEAPAEGALPLYDFLGAGAEYNYQSVIYIKGAIVLNMLRHWMGDERFWGGIRDYYLRYRDMNVTSTMFREVMEEHAEESLVQYFDQWVYSGGWPMLTVRQLDTSPAGGLRIGLQQRQQDEKGWPLFEMPVDVEIVTTSGDTLVLRRMLHALAQDMFVFDEVQSSDVASWRLDPEGWLLHEAQMVTGVEADAMLPPAPRLESAYPQPLPRGATMAMQPFLLPQAGVVSLEVHDVLGRRIRTVAEGWFDAGRHIVPVDLSGCAAGHYRLLLRTTEGSSAGMILVQ
ncbi:MAG: hypothetical protein IH600_10085 [Bacteroidetes bacterium]|nr:hypothetical protein [Bacteroidota bacterium]